MENISYKLVEKKLKNFKKIKLDERDSKKTRGKLVSIEGNRSIPFQIKRIYYMYGDKHESARGFHCHKNLTQLAICVSGSCKFILDDGKKRYNLSLQSPNEGLLIYSPIWREIYDFCDNSVLLILASEYFDENDYIRSYDEFVEYIKHINFSN